MCLFSFFIHINLEEPFTKHVWQDIFSSRMWIELEVVNWLDYVVDSS